MLLVACAVFASARTVVVSVDGAEVDITTKLYEEDPSLITVTDNFANHTREYLNDGTELINGVYAFQALEDIFMQNVTAGSVFTEEAPAALQEHGIVGYVMITLDQVYDIVSYEFHGQSGYAMKSFKILVSEDGKKYSVVSSVSNNKTERIISGEFEEAAAAKYIVVGITAADKGAVSATIASGADDGWFRAAEFDFNVIEKGEGPVTYEFGSNPGSYDDVGEMAVAIEAAPCHQSPEGTPDFAQMPSIYLYPQA